MSGLDEDTAVTDESASSWRTSSEQEQALLGGLPITAGDGKEGWHDGKDEPADLGETCFTIRWWHLVAFLILCTMAVPATVKVVHKDSYRHGGSKPISTDAPSSLQNDYILAPDWDFMAAPTLREYHWELTEIDHNPDGVYRPMLVINNQFPGPLIEVNEGDTIRVNVQNSMTNATAIHWHGIYQNGTNWMDGTVGITQCPIAPGDSFTYEFTVKGQSGTYWYHAHQGVQSSDGLHGPLIIHSREGHNLQKIEYATDRIIMLSDHYHDISGHLAKVYMAPDMENAEPVPDGALINGRAIRNCDDLPHRRCDNSTTGLPTFALEPNQYHRLRVINVGAFAEFQFQIDEHELAVTEVDGTDVLPLSYHRLNINPAQRYSVILHTNNTQADSFRMRARMITTCFATPNPYMAGEVHGIVHYGAFSNQSQQIVLPDTKDWSEAQWLQCRDLNTTELVPVEVMAAPEEADEFFYIRSNFEIGAHRLSRGKFNTSSWRPDVYSPTLMRTVDGLQGENASFSIEQAPGAFVNKQAFDIDRELVIQSSGIRTIDILFSNFDDGNHPLHLHGYKFFVLAQGHGYPPQKSVFDGINRDNLEPLYKSLNLSNPLRRDTASVEGFGWILIRLIADNPGAWPLHCHISWHAEAGLLMQLLTRTDVMSTFQIPEANQALCAAQGLEKGMGPKDVDYY